MIAGYIDGNLEARIELPIVHHKGTEVISFLLDTGFNGYLAISPSLVESLDLPLDAVQRGITADGRAGFFDTVRVTVIWHDRPLVVRAQVLDEPLIGTRLLAGSELAVKWEAGATLDLK